MTLPNELFFGPDQLADFSKELDDERKTEVPVRPLIEILTRYKFTVEENTPLEQEIALDPELLGKVFENLLPLTTMTPKRLHARNSVPSTRPAT